MKTDYLGIALDLACALLLLAAVVIIAPREHDATRYDCGNCHELIAHPAPYLD